MEEMKMNTKHTVSRALLIGLSIIGLASCQDPIDLDVPDGEKVLVVEGWLTNDSTQDHTVKLTYTSPYFDANTPPPATGAKVELKDETSDNTYLLVENPTGSGVYEIPILSEIDHVYSLRIEVDNEVYVSLPEQVNFVPEILEIYDQYDEDQEAYEVLISTYEPEGVGDNYRWRYWVDGVYQNEPFDIAYAEDELVDGNPINDVEVTDWIIFMSSEDATINSAGVPVDNDGNKIDADVVIDRDSVLVKVEQSTISRNAFDFFFILQEQTGFIGGIFDPPPSPIKGNIVKASDPEEYALGFFGVSAVSVAEVWVVDDQAN